MSADDLDPCKCGADIGVLLGERIRRIEARQDLQAQRIDALIAQLDALHRPPEPIVTLGSEREWRRNAGTTAYGPLPHVTTCPCPDHRNR